MIAHPVATELATDFFIRFSRFEFALKKAGFRIPSGGNGVKADWQGFSQQENIAALFALLQNNPDANYLIHNPPKRRVMNGAYMDWQDMPIPQDMESLNAAMARARNNLFHGDKSNPNLSRNVQLFTAGLAIIEAMLNAHEGVRSEYEIGTENA